MNPKLRFVNKNTIQLCCKRKCPIVELKNDFIFISDDYGNQIKIKIEEAFLIKDAVESFLK